MPTIVPSLLKLVGQGFRSDPYAADGNHLRWSFDQRLGFPRYAFCVESRPSVLTREGRAGLASFLERFPLTSGSTSSTEFVRPNLLVRKAPATAVINTSGLGT